MAYDQNNVFARILRGEISCTPIFKNEFAWAFHDLRPQRKTHVLLIPTGANIDAADFATSASVAHMQGFWQAFVAVQQQLGLDSTGCRIISNLGADSGQEVPHFHVHILGGEPVGPLVG